MFSLRQGHFVSEPEKERLRPWREIAAELANEKDPERVRELVKELTRALDSQALKKPSQPAKPPVA
jgi:hypothetical protein